MSSSSVKGSVHSRMSSPANSPAGRPVEDLQTILQYRFHSKALLVQALTHKSHSAQHNERLEFLGDAILNFVIADLLYQKFDHAKEGELTRRRANLVNGKALSKKAKEFNLGAFLLLGQGEKLSGGFRRQSILANSFESIVGAIYLDGGYERIREKLEQWFAAEIALEAQTTPEKDPKTVLQEWLQGQQRPLPQYQVISVDGPQHEQSFCVQLVVDGFDAPIVASGGSRRIAEQRAAKQFLQQVSQEDV